MRFALLCRPSLTSGTAGMDSCLAPASEAAVQDPIMLRCLRVLETGVKATVMHISNMRFPFFAREAAITF
ncbi:hypothetical protein AURDEDRAFT_177207 [Auricularia subglabra TFB-10046 SS5]|uniref:Uncharacterized protein n=1 Tax=Auricularia subglabra (strain TFB-10046 / SS5) TaxID=717982 RepID=J0WMY0_AURST|nr:hypothetical protein AURDEDRAFT_177207 [Auricularia subglabra TFB-10046 SS5]